MVVDLPAPLGPRKPSTSPLSTRRSMPVTAAIRPKFLVKPSMTLMVGMAQTNLGKTGETVVPIKKSRDDFKGARPASAITDDLLRFAARTQSGRQRESRHIKSGPRKGAREVRRDPEKLPYISSAGPKTPTGRGWGAGSNSRSRTYRPTDSLKMEPQKGARA